MIGLLLLLIIGLLAYALTASVVLLIADRRGQKKRQRRAVDCVNQSDRRAP